MCAMEINYQSEIYCVNLTKLTSWESLNLKENSLKFHLGLKKYSPSILAFINLKVDFKKTLKNIQFSLNILPFFLCFVVEKIVFILQCVI